MEEEEKQKLYQSVETRLLGDIARTHLGIGFHRPLIRIDLPSYFPSEVDTRTDLRKLQAWADEQKAKLIAPVAATTTFGLAVTGRLPIALPASVDPGTIQNALIDNILRLLVNPTITGASLMSQLNAAVERLGDKALVPLPIGGGGPTAATDLSYFIQAVVAHVIYSGLGMGTLFTEASVATALARALCTKGGPIFDVLKVGDPVRASFRPSELPAAFEEDDEAPTSKELARLSSDIQRMWHASFRHGVALVINRLAAGVIVGPNTGNHMTQFCEGAAAISLGDDDRYKLSHRTHRLNHYICGAAHRYTESANWMMAIAKRQPTPKSYREMACLHYLAAYELAQLHYWLSHTRCPSGMLAQFREAYARHVRLFLGSVTAAYKPEVVGRAARVFMTGGGWLSDTPAPVLRRPEDDILDEPYSVMLTMMAIFDVYHRRSMGIEAFETIDKDKIATTVRGLLLRTDHYKGRPSDPLAGCMPARAYLYMLMTAKKGDRPDGDTFLFTCLFPEA